MALDEFDGCLSLPASTDLSAKEFFAVKVDTNGQLALCGAGDAAVGILYSKPNAQAVVAMVKPLNGHKVKGVAGGTIAKGAFLASDANGKLVTATKGTGNPLTASNVVGIAVDAAVVNDIFQFIGYPMGAVPTTNA